MLNEHVRPTTLEGVKRLATHIRKAEGINHAAALDKAALRADCSNFRHARKVLPSTSAGNLRHRVWLTAYWLDKKTYQRGRVTSELTLSKPILDIASRSDLKLVRGFASMRMVAPDHFVRDPLVTSADAAREELCEAERSLRFMEHTGLRPWRAARKYPGDSARDKLPNQDHATDWLDPTTGQFLLIDEPYANVPDEEKRNGWARRHGWALHKSSWPGMYSPGNCSLYVATDAQSGYDVGKILEKIDAMPLPITSEQWTGESVSSWDVFVSPAAKTPQDRRRARPQGTIMPRATATSAPYSSMFGSSRRRPLGTLTVAGHKLAGRTIKAILGSSARPATVWTLMDGLRSTLEDWMEKETLRQLDDAEFFDVYYHELADDDPLSKTAETKAGVIQLLGGLNSQLRVAYPDCEALRKQLRRIDRSISATERMKEKRARKGIRGPKWSAGGPKLDDI